MNPDSLFKNYKKKFIRQLGKGALYNFQLDALGKQLLGKKYLGTFAQDKLPTRSGYLIVNVDTSKRITKTLYVYDSYGRLTKNVLNLKTKKKIVDSKHDPEQRKK